jgi:hypothetical protein
VIKENKKKKKYKKKGKIHTPHQTTTQLSMQKKTNNYMSVTIPQNLQEDKNDLKIVL